MDFCTPKEAAGELGISKTRVLLYIRANKLQAYRVGKQWAIPREALDAFKSLDRKRGRPKSELRTTN